MRNLAFYAVLLPLTCGAADRFYPTIGPDGRVMVIPGQESGKEKTDKPVEAGKAVVPVEKSAPPVKANVDGESYLSSEELEGKGFKPEGKNRFYYLPDGGHGYTPIESDAGLPLLLTPSKSREGTASEALRPSPNYQVIDAAEVVRNTPALSRCLTQADLKKAMALSDAGRLSIEEPLVEAGAEADALINLQGLKEGAIRIRSFSSTISRPGYYMPFALWFNQKGCVISGAWNYWLNEIPGTEFRFGSIEALLIQPPEASYLGFYYPAPKQRVPFRLQRRGSMTLDVFE